MWAYQRRLSQDIAARRDSETEAEHHMTTEKKERRHRKGERKESTDSIPPEERRIAIEGSAEESDEDAVDRKPEEPTHKNHRRFSLDFLFGKKHKKGDIKGKTKRSQSIAGHNNEPAEQDIYKGHRYPGIENNDFSYFYFI